MPSFWENDLAIFFNDFGTDAIYGAATIKVLFHNEYEPVSLFASEIEGRNPFVEVRDSDIAGIAHDSTLTINAVAYKVKEIKPDGTGITALILSKD